MNGPVSTIAPFFNVKKDKSKIAFFDFGLLRFIIVEYFLSNFIFSSKTILIPNKDETMYKYSLTLKFFDIEITKDPENTLFKTFLSLARATDFATNESPIFSPFLL